MIEERQSFLREVDVCVAALRDVLGESLPNSSQLVAAQNSLKSFNLLAGAADTDSFQLIGQQLENIFDRFISETTVPTPLEHETIELAVDWLEQLATLYAEAIPEPRTLVSELIYTFDLVERSQGAVSLAALMAGVEEEPDLFVDDPEISVADCHEAERCDPFNDDPGFGLEFDLLQRTLNRLPAEGGVTVDPFGDDPRLSEESVTEVAEGVDPPYDVFADDPPLSEAPK